MKKKSNRKNTKYKKKDSLEEYVFLKDKIDLLDKRYLSFLCCFTLMKERSVKRILETGTARNGRSNFKGDGGSTILFGEWIERYGGELYSIDIDKNNLLQASDGLKDQTGRVYFIQSDSIKFLKTFNKPIDFLYLDSYDYDAQNPNPSQEHHLKEIIAAYPCLSKKSIVMIDDCNLENGGKGKLVIDYLLQKGWKLLVNAYQVILVQSFKKKEMQKIEELISKELYVLRSYLESDSKI